MVEVIIRQPGFPDRLVPVREGRTYLGRADDNEIVLSDVGVSRRHAAIVFGQGEVSIEDLGSGNGTYYFGHRVKTQPIRDQDEVVIDPFILQFRVVNGPDTVPMSGPDTVVADEGVRLEVVVGNGLAGTVYPIRPTGLTMGRAEDRDVVVPDPASSRHHCHITLEGTEYVLHDNGSANGVFVNAVRVRECTLSDGDLVRIGNTELRFVNPASAYEEPRAWSPPPVAPVAEAWPEASEPAEADAEGEEEGPWSDPPSESDPRPLPRQGRAQPAPEPASGGRGQMVLAALGGVAVLGVLAGTLAVGLVAIGLMVFTGGPAGPVPLPPRPLAWSLKLPADLEGSNTEQMYVAGIEAAEASDYALALQNLFRVLSADPSHKEAKRFAAFSAQILVERALTEELEVRVAERTEFERKRARLLREAQTSSNNRVKRDAKRELERDFRDDVIVQEEMSWGLTQAQLDLRDQADRVENHVQREQMGEAGRLGRRLLETSRERTVRDRVHGLVLKADAAQARAVAARWRTATLAEASGDRATANERYKLILKDDPTNVSAQLGAARTGTSP